MLAKHYQKRPSEFLGEVVELSDSDKVLVDWTALDKEVNDHFEETLKGISKKAKRVDLKKERSEKPPPPQFVNPKFWKGKKWDKWSK